jgi:amidase
MAARVEGVRQGMAHLEPGFAPAPEPARRIGRVRLPAETEIDDALDSALRAIGLPVVELVLAGWDEATTATMTILMAEAWQVHGEMWKRHAGELSPDVSERLRNAESISAPAVVEARRQKAEWQMELTAVFERVDLMALPTLAASPPSLEDAARIGELRYVAPFNLAGVPALALPVGGAAARRIPASLQLVGPAGSEELLVATAAAVEEAAGFRASG